MGFPLSSFVRRSIDPLCQAVRHHLRQWTKPDTHALALNAALDLTRSKSELVLENALMRQQLVLQKRQVKRPALTWRDRALLVLLASKLRMWKEALVIVQPDTGCAGTDNSSAGSGDAGQAQDEEGQTTFA